MTQTAHAVLPAQGYAFRPTGVVFHRDLSQAEWEGCGRKLAQIANGTVWGIGDWLVYGMGLGPKGGTYTVAQALTGRSYDNLCQLARVSEAFPIEARSTKVPWSHYREALRLAPEDRPALLALAEESRLSRDAFSQHIEDHLAAKAGRPARTVRGGTISIRERRQEDRLGLAPKSPGRRKNLEMRCPHCGHQWTARVQAEAVVCGTRQE